MHSAALSRMMGIMSYISGLPTPLTPVVPRVMSRLFNHRNRLCPEEVIRTRRKLPAHDLLGFRFRQWQGSLAEHVAPACWSANISIAKPQLVVGWFISLHQLDP